eukprot:GHVS01100096.1.p1 GENE.GHVS01100096.1~~GHVS01100096.1.p1  ORF type:complete len:116 (-),score=7.96 GHVS01100096.1:49-396(-)
MYTYTYTRTYKHAHAHNADTHVSLNYNVQKQNQKKRNRKNKQPQRSRHRKKTRPTDCGGSRGRRCRHCGVRQRRRRSQEATMYRVTMVRCASLLLNTAHILLNALPPGGTASTDS